MAVKPTELKQRAEEKKAKQFNEQVATLEASIEEILVYHADAIMHGESAEYTIGVGVKNPSQNAIAEVERRYLAAGWEIYKSLDDWGSLQLTFKPKQE